MSGAVRLGTVLAAALALGAPGWGESALPQTGASSVRVNITSQPVGATVILDGVDRGITPVNVFDLAPGRHHLRYRLAGYVERDRFFTVEDGPDKVLERNEVLAEERGLLLVHAEPEGCRVYVDGVPSGCAPRLFTHLTTKDAHVVRVSKRGYRDQTFTLSFDGRTPVYRKAVLQLDAGAITLNSEPAGASVTVNGIACGQTPQVVTNVPRGVATVSFALTGYETATRELALAAGERQAVHVALRPLPGTLRLVAQPDGCAFFLDDAPCGTGQVTLTGLSNGVYEVRCEKAGHACETRRVSVGAEAPAEVVFRLSDSVGSLAVHTQPPRAEVLLDGRFLGRSAANGLFEAACIPEGEHALLVRAEGYVEANARVKIRTGETSRGTMRLRREFLPDVEVTTERGVTPGVLVEDGADAITLEVSPGITRTFLRGEVRAVKRLSASGAASR